MLVASEGGETPSQWTLYMKCVPDLNRAVSGEGGAVTGLECMLCESNNTHVLLVECRSFLAVTNPSPLEQHSPIAPTNDRHGRKYDFLYVPFTYTSSWRGCRYIWIG